MRMTGSKANVMPEVCPDPHHILEPGIKFKMGPYGDFHSTVFCLETYRGIDIMLGMLIPYEKTYKH